MDGPLTTSTAERPPSLKYLSEINEILPKYIKKVHEDGRLLVHAAFSLVYLQLLP